MAHPQCVAEARSNNEHTNASVPIWYALARTPLRVCEGYVKLQVDTNGRLTLLLRFAPTFSTRARPDLRCVASLLNHGAFEFLFAPDSHLYNGPLGRAPL
jgi:hypothetical protein